MNGGTPLIIAILALKGKGNVFHGDLIYTYTLPECISVN